MNNIIMYNVIPENTCAICQYQIIIISFTVIEQRTPKYIIK